MSVLEKILTWSKDIPPWQSDALRRLLPGRDLSEDDSAELVALAKLHCGIPDEKNRKPHPLSEKYIPKAGVEDNAVILRSLGELKNVNALVETQELRFAEKGATVIYGDNGSGKSGYARVLKRACRARDDESVLPNAMLPKGKHGKPEGRLTVSVGKDVKTERWVDGQPSPELLSTLSVFDGHCARVYLDDENDIAFKPYGLDLVEALGEVCKKIREEIQKENNSIHVDVSAFDDLKGPTKVGELVASLSAKTDPKTVTALASLDETETKRIEELKAILKEGNPLEKAKSFRAEAARLARLAETCDTRARELGDATITRMKGVDEAYVAAQRASDLVAKSLKEDTSLLPGTGGEAWRGLLVAAQKYSKEAYPGHAFPHVEDGAKCVLCQQELTGGKDRYRRFGEFLANVAEEQLRKATADLKEIEKETERFEITLPMDDELAAGIKTVNETLAESCKSFRDSLGKRRTSIAKAIAEHTWGTLDALSDNPAVLIRSLSQGLVSTAETLEKSADKAVRDELEQEQREINAREALQKKKDNLLKAVERFQYKSKLSECAGAIDIGAITRKDKALTQEAVSEALGTALNKEFGALGVDYLKVTYSTRGEQGKTLQKLTLDVPGAHDIASILSEGEQRALAIASFLAEVSLAPGSSGLIFDDPVSSLDHLRREKVAARLIGESANRQIIVFTHDLYFLGLLNNEAAKQNVPPILCQSVTKQGREIGVLSSDLPFAGQNTRQRIGSLKQLAQQALAAKRAGKNTVSDALVKSGYEQLREAWERAVEEVLFNGVVERFEKGVHTQQLSGVLVEDKDFAEIDAAMTRCSELTHDRPRAGGTTTLDPAEYEKDISALETFRDRIVKRMEGVKKSRKKN